MKKLIGWWNREAGYPKEKRGVTFVKSLLLALLPLVCVLVYCGSQGYSVGEVYLPSSEWNDELFYFKQVEGIVNYGYPQGYFGFNESHALKLSFAAWSPVLVFPWILWGVLFGWDLMAPVYCNIVLLTVCCFLFVWLVKPKWKQLGVLALLFCLYTPFVRYMLSGMPEVICFSLLILFYALAIHYQRSGRGRELAGLFLLSGVLTLMRPYMLLFLLLPVWFLVRREREKGKAWRGVLVSGAVVVLVLGAYACIKHYFGAEYFAPLFFTDWVSAYFEEGIFGGIRFTVSKLYYMGMDFLRHTWQGFRTGLASGAFFACHLVCAGVLVVWSVRDWRVLRRRGAAEEKGLLAVEVHMAFSFIAMLFALLLMYKLTEGSKHLLTFIAAAVFVIPLMDTYAYKKAVLVGVTFAYFLSYRAVDPYDYQVPFVEEERKCALESWGDALEGELVLEGEERPNYDNVVIWVLGDRVEGVVQPTPWQLLYALPPGFGISCCMGDYVVQNFEGLQSRYLACLPGGEVEERCREAGYQLIFGDGDMVLYRVFR